MPQVINSNFAAANAQRNLASSQHTLTLAVQRLSSGLRVNSSKDDAAGLAISERMNSQVRGFTVAIRNANDGISLAQTAEGALGKLNDALQRMRELALQSRNATNNVSDRQSLDDEFGELSQEIQRVTGGTTFNSRKILSTDAGTQVFQVGSGTTTDDTINITTANLFADATITAVAGTDNLGTGRAAITDTGATTVTDIGAVIDKIDAALETVSSERANLGAAQNRFEAVIANLQVSNENIGASRGRIIDADYAMESANFSRTNILQQAGTAMLAQANQLPQGVLKLLG